MKKICNRLVPLVLSLVMLMCLGLDAFADEPAKVHPCQYEYVLHPLQDGVSDGIVRLELYIMAEWAGTPTGERPEPLLDAGAFGLQFPEWLSGHVTFAPSEYVTLQRIVPEERHTYDPNEMELKGNGYHAFNWFGRMEPGPQGTIIKGKGWGINLEAGGYCMKIGEYTMDLKAATETDETTETTTWRLPYNTDVGQLDWLTIPEAVAAEVWDTTANGQDALNRTLWNPETNLYQGYYDDPDADPDIGAAPVQTDIGFRFKAPEAWPSGNAKMILQSYDPKKAVTIKLYKWVEATGEYNAAADYELELEGELSGSGLCRQTINFADAEFTYVPVGNKVQGSNLQNGKYELVIRKASHVNAYLTGVTVSREDGELKLFPELDGKSLSLPCGDVTGDGQIQLRDRAELMRPGRYMKTAADRSVYDLNGDGRLDQKDLAILTARSNYGKNSYRKIFSETTNVGENGI